MNKSLLHYSRNTKALERQMNKEGKFLKKLRCYTARTR